MPEPAAGLSIVIDEDNDNVRVDPVTGTIETDQPDGGVVVQLDARNPKADTAADDWFGNLADDLDGAALGSLANDLYSAVEADDRSRQEHLQIRARGLDLLGIKLQEPRSDAGTSSGAVDGMATVTNPLLLEAVLKGWANAQAELLPSGGPVKIKNQGDETPADDDLAESLERDFNHYLTDVATEYYPDTSHMILWGVYFGGGGTKKIYRCPLRRRPVSESIDDKDFIVSDTTKDLRSCGRITHQIPMRPSVMKRMQAIGAYRDVTLTQPTPTPNAVSAKEASIQGTQPQKDRPEDQPYTVWEVQCELDLDEFVPSSCKYKNKGIPLPFLATMDKDSREILALRRDWDEDDEECTRKRMYVRYPYIPGPGFYGTGLLNILGNSSAAMTAAWRLALDSAMYATFPAFLVAKLAGRQNSVDVRVAPGTGVPIETNGLPISSVAAPMPYKGAGADMFQMMDKVLAQAKNVGSVADMPTAEGVQNVPVGTILTQVEQATKVEGAAFKGMHHAQAEEFQLLLDLFRANPEDFWRGNTVAPKDYWSEQKLLQALDDVDLVPVADPNVPSHIHRVAKGLALVQLFQVFPQQMNPTEVLQRVLRVIREDPTGLIVQPAPAPAAPDPNLIKAQAAQTSANAAQMNAVTKAQDSQADQQTKLAGLQVDKDIATLDLSREMIVHQNDKAKADADIALAATQQRHDQNMDIANHVADQAQSAKEHSLNVAQHALDVHQALNAPEPESGA